MNSIVSLREGSDIWNLAQGLYSEGFRAYHTFDHAKDVLARVERVETDIGFMSPDAVRLAALFHDAVYVVGADDNETRSALTMTRILYDNIQATLSEEFEQRMKFGQCVDKAAVLIRATSQHLTHREFYTDWDTMLFLDCDVRGFATLSWDKFSASAKAIEAEYASMAGFNPEEYKEGRVKFLTTMYRKGVFRSPYFRKNYEKVALDNIREHLIELGSDITLTA